MNKVRVFTVAWGIVASACALLISTSVRAQDAQKEVDKQIAKLIGDAVSARVAAQTVAIADALKTAERPNENNAWASYSSIHIDIPDVPSTRTATYLVGYDRTFNPKTIGGISFATADTSGSDIKYWSTSPYLAYTFTDSLFTILKGTYAESKFNGKKTHAYGVDVSLNGINRYGNLISKWRAGIGRTEPQDGDGTTIGSADFELGYDFGSGMIAFAGLQASTTDKSSTYQLSARAGVEKQFGKNSAVTLKYEQKVDDNYGFSGVDVYVVTLAVRIGF